MADPLSMRLLAQALIQSRGVMPGTRHEPFSDEENIAYGYPGQGDAYDNPKNPNYWLNQSGGEDEDLPPLDQELNPQQTQGPMSWHRPSGMGADVFQPDTYPAIDKLMQQDGDGQDSEGYFDTDMGMQELYGVDPYGNPLPGMQQQPEPRTAADFAEVERRKQAIMNRGRR